MLQPGSDFVQNQPRERIYKFQLIRLTLSCNNYTTRRSTKKSEFKFFFHFTFFPCWYIYSCCNFVGNFFFSSAAYVCSLHMIELKKFVGKIFIYVQFYWFDNELLCPLHVLCVPVCWLIGAIAIIDKAKWTDKPVIYHTQIDSIITLNYTYQAFTYFNPIFLGTVL
jgi:hypothetical protein